ncbi:MAG: hypothetical protein ACTMIR_01840 [Cellulomonadaceae bacterium]
MTAVICAVAALVSGLAVVILLCPVSGADTMPPTCWATPGYEVPCQSTWCVGGALAAAAVAGALVWLVIRPAGRRPRH